ncbi:hypothetical protein SAMN05421541_12721 [Actinoplanes philippinensis]|uniref:Uncharacterized protein n=1 Tax=Actinoplanes philippinensis TaxID=35752 RepID=A0A1I2MDF1_9ACTN|nr:hypothetical protein SAMN05421541_12721 [Actinoplanes philippinensis]
MAVTVASGAPRKVAAWPAATFRRWFGTWFSLYAAAHFILMATALIFARIAYRPENPWNDRTEGLKAILAYSFMVLGQGLLGVLLLWFLGRDRSRMVFRSLSVLLFVLVWTPFIPLLGPLWLCATVTMAVTIKPPVPAYYGSTRRIRRRAGRTGPRRDDRPGNGPLSAARLPG